MVLGKPFSSATNVRFAVSNTSNFPDPILEMKSRPLLGSRLPHNQNGWSFRPANACNPIEQTAHPAGGLCKGRARDREAEVASKVEQNESQASASHSPLGQVFTVLIPTVLSPKFPQLT